MISITIKKKNGVTQNGYKIATELRGLSTDTKPTTIIDENGLELEIDNGSVYIEIDTGKIFMFDAENQQWKEF